MSEEDFSLKPFVKTIKDELGLGKIRVNWLQNNHQASCIISTGEINLPTVQAIERTMNLSHDEARSKQKMAVIEEVCHLAQKRDGHSQELYQCVVKLHDRHLTGQERELVKEKLERLRLVCEGVLTQRVRVKPEVPKMPPEVL